MQLQAGKYYLNRKGEKVGPLVRRDYGFVVNPRIDAQNHIDFFDDGTISGCSNQSSLDLISEYKDDELFETKKVFITSHPNNLQSLVAGLLVGVNLYNLYDMKFLLR